MKNREPKFLSIDGTSATEPASYGLRHLARLLARRAARESLLGFEWQALVDQLPNKRLSLLFISSGPPTDLSQQLAMRAAKAIAPSQKFDPVSSQVSQLRRRLSQMARDVGRFISETRRFRMIDFFNKICLPLTKVRSS